MDIYHVWCDLKPGQRDLEFSRHIAGYLGKLKSEGLIEGYRLTRRKLGFGVPELGEFHIMIETRDLAQLERAFQTVSTRSDPVESLHHAVNSRVENFKAALYRDFPDSHRQAGQEKF